MFYFLHSIEHCLKLYHLAFNLFIINIPPAECKFHTVEDLCVLLAVASPLLTLVPDPQSGAQYIFNKFVLNKYIVEISNREVEDRNEV